MKYDAASAIRRNTRFMTHPERSGTLIVCDEFGDTGLPVIPPLESFNFPGDLRIFCDCVIEHHLRFREAHEEFDDDWIPTVMPRLGIAEHSCFLGGKVIYGGNTSYQYPVLRDITCWQELRLERDHPHYAMLLDAMAYLYSKRNEYGYFTRFRGTDGPMDIAQAVCGNDLFYDLYDDPENVKGLLSFCAEAAAWNIEQQRPFVSVIDGGSVSGMGTWMPGRAIGHLSEDASCLCSPDMYRLIGLGALQKLVRPYDYAFLHVHSLGRACIPLFAAIPQIRTFQLSGDPHQPDGIDVYREYAEQLAGKTVLLDMDAEQLLENAAFLKGRRTIVNLHTRSKEEARFILDRFHDN